LPEEKKKKSKGFRESMDGKVSEDVDYEKWAEERGI
jgi:hypothetical protein